MPLGAYTARALAGMIEKVGLLPAGNHQQVPFAYKMYMKDDEMGKPFVTEYCVCAELMMVLRLEAERALREFALLFGKRILTWRRKRPSQ